MKKFTRYVVEQYQRYSENYDYPKATTKQTSDFKNRMMKLLGTSSAPIKKKEVKKMLILERDYSMIGKSKVKVDTTECPSGWAYTWQVQTRSADEPPTTFYRCKDGKKTWREY